MVIGIVGAGVSGITFAIRRKMLHKEDEVILFEHLDKPLKKILSTGNGKCNIGNASNYDHMSEERIPRYINLTYDYDRQKEFLNSLNIKTKLMHDLSYPISESAVTVRNLFLEAVDKYGIQIITEVDILDYRFSTNSIVLLTSKGEHKLDKLVFATGGKSSPKLGSDGSILPVLNKHGYQLLDFKPALCPIYTKEKTKVLDGTRVKATVTVQDGNKTIFKEDGELLFKDHGLSGIVIFNASRVLAKEEKPYRILIDLLPSVSKEELEQFLKENGVNALLNSYLHPNLVKFVSSLNLKEQDVIRCLKAMQFTFDKLYGFDNSQISVGGIKFDSITNSLESKTEKGIYFLGELLNFDAPCGGFNIMWAIGTGLYLAEQI